MSSRPIDTLVIHCSASPNGRWQTVADIDQWHGERGFKRNAAAAEGWNPTLRHLGYHWVIYTNGGLASGRHADEVGAHARGLNARSLGLCLVGTDQFSVAQWIQLRSQVDHLATRHRIRLQPATEANGWRGVCGHRDTGANKRCPGFDVAQWLAAGMEPQPANILETVQ